MVFLGGILSSPRRVCFDMFVLSGGGSRHHASRVVYTRPRRRIEDAEEGLGSKMRPIVVYGGQQNVTDAVKRSITGAFCVVTEILRSIH